MRERRKGGGGGVDVVSWSRFFWCTLFVVFSCVILSGFTFSSFRLFFGGQCFKLVIGESVSLFFSCQSVVWNSRKLIPSSVSRGRFRIGNFRWNLIPGFIELSSCYGRLDSY